jgi:hypothetical protein
MKELHGEGLASHTDPESCVVSREAGHEVLIGAHAGRVSSRLRLSDGYSARKATVGSTSQARRAGT